MTTITESEARTIVSGIEVAPASLSGNCYLLQRFEVLSSTDVCKLLQHSPMAFSIACVILCFTFIIPSLSLSTSPGIHLPLFRRGGRFSRHETANLTHLTQVLNEVETRYSRSQRAVNGNQLVRRWRRSKGGDENDPEVIDVTGCEHRW